MRRSIQLALLAEGCTSPNPLVGAIVLDSSGVLVGAMLGLVARMRFQRVLAACFIGGTAASITWAYTARGIIEVMERYHAEAFIPFVILLAIGFTWLKIRDNKRHRREELFKESMSFFAGASE